MGKLLGKVFLDCKQFVECLILRLIDDAETAGAKDFQDLVLTQQLSRLQILHSYLPQIFTYQMLPARDAGVSQFDW